MKNTINAAIQVVPKCTQKDYYPLIDQAIEVIKKSGLNYLVTPMETVIEGPYQEVMDTMELAQRAALDAGADELIVSIKLHIRKDADVSFEEKITKHIQD